MRSRNDKCASRNVKRTWERGRILVNVPRSSYFNMIWTGVDHREPSIEELHAAAARTKEHIVKAVKGLT